MMTLIVLNSTSQVFGRKSLNTYLVLFPGLDGVYGLGEEYHKDEVPFLSYNITGCQYDMAEDVNLDHLAEQCLLGFSPVN